MAKEQRTKVDELRDALKRKQARPDEATPAPGAAPEEGRAPASMEREPQELKEASADELTRQIQAAEEEAKGHYDKLLRVMAEFENFKKRMAREGEENLRYANEKLLTDLLPAMDDLDRVLAHAPPTASEDAKAIAEGVELVRKSLASTLERFGLKEVEAKGADFDPTCHEAIAVVESEAVAPNKVASVHRRGFKLHGRLLRPALVTVAKGAENEEADKNSGDR